ncbi:MAG: glycosyltransferase family protein [Azoarcus sp.]|jgi:hypothetical protein|nr:glycosyltransferase family protein [Azoarcus sp.]
MSHKKTPTLSAPFFSIIICSIDPWKFAQVSACYEHLLAEVPHEIIGIHDARSLAEGYNRGVQQAQGDITLFSHDDILILDPGFAPKIASRLQNIDILGFTGTRRLVDEYWWGAGLPWLAGSIAHIFPNDISLNVYGAAAWPLVENIQAIDGLCIMARRETALEIGFDQTVFDGFHLYDLDFSFSAWQAGKKIAVCCDIPVIHASMGNYDAKHEKYARLFLEKHKDALPTPSPPKKRAPEGRSMRFSDHRALLAAWNPNVFQRTNAYLQRQLEKAG